MQLRRKILRMVQYSLTRAEGVNQWMDFKKNPPDCIVSEGYILIIKI